MKNGFYRVAAAAPAVTVADTSANADAIISMIDKAYTYAADVVVMPEMCITAYTCGDLFHNHTLLEGALTALHRIADHTAECPGMLVVVGLPVACRSSVYNCAAFVSDGAVHGLISKTFLPNYSEFYERRWFTAAPADGDALLAELWAGCRVPLQGGSIFEYKGVKISAEICEDLWTAIPPSSSAALAGAELIVNLSASDDMVGKRAYLRHLVEHQSARCMCAYAYASAGFGESSTDLVFDAKLFIAENGYMLAANEPWHREPQLQVADVDIEALRRDRIHNTSFAACAARNYADAEVVNIDAGKPLEQPVGLDLMRFVDPHPFVPYDSEEVAQRCEEIINIQVAGLAQRLKATRCSRLVVGVSGGLDSTLALLVATRAFDALGLDRKGIVGVTMPGFGTTGRTYGNAIKLMRTLGVDVREISIVRAVNVHFEDIGHNPALTDVTYENSQARERTQILMDLANEVGGMVLGTGDLSELALGWATYNGDHMSMYGVNAGVPKTLVRYLTRYFADETSDQAEREALLDIVDTPISPELIPAKADGSIAQKTEDLVGPYELHDFFLYYTLRYGFSPKRIFMLARNAFAGEFDRETILKWERTFFRRFFAQQFKRSALPDGPKVGSVCLSPRGDWRMPSDASARLWLDELDKL